MAGKILYIKHLHFSLLCCAILCLQGCSVKKFIPEGELLYTKGSVEIDTTSQLADIKELQTELERVLRPDPNGKILGMRLGLLVHYKAQRENPGFLNKWLNKKIGEEPVYASDVDLTEVEEILLNRLENSGFFYSQVTSAMIEKPEKKEAEAVYTVDLEDPYLLEEYILDGDSLQVYQEIAEHWEQTMISPGMRFDLSTLKAERDRIDRNLKSNGYYNFNPQFLIFEADTNQYENRKFDLFLLLKKDVPEKAIIPYKIQQVNIYPNYVIESDTIQRDTVRYENKNYIQDEVFFKPKRLDPYILIEEDSLYNPDDSRFTSRRLTTIGAYKYVNIQYEEIDSLSTDSLGILEANIYLSPLTKRALRAELQAVTKSNDFVGPGLSLTYSNRNLFHGGEILNLTGELGYEWQMGSKDQKSLSSLRLGADADLFFPRKLFPIPINTDNNWFKYSIPKTRIGVGMNYLDRKDLYRMYSFHGEFGYNWQANRFLNHELTPLSINYVDLGKTTPEFDQILLDNPYLQNSFQQQFIAGLMYSLTYNGMVDDEKTHQFFINTNLDLAGNTIDLFTGSSGEEPQKVLGLEFAQYAKLDFDVRYHFKVGSEQKIATRLFAGYGMPYGNSDVMPFSKQYFSGGPYSVRAFKIRGLGPGSFNPEESQESAYFDQAGNVRLEANIEYRFPIIPFLNGAVFADAGNVWNTGDVEYLEGGKFSSDFLTELGIGVGFGLRVDIQHFVIRFDLAAPVHIPWLPKGERWDPRFSEPVLNFGIGYPF